jgi:predicted PurR-regulated permease PerM
MTGPSAKPPLAAVVGHDSPGEAVGDPGRGRGGDAGAGPPATAAQRATLRALAYVLVAASLLLVWSSWASIVLATWTAILARPALVRLERIFRGRRAATAAVVLALVAVIVVPLIACVVVVTSGARDLAASLVRAPTARGALEALLANGGADGAPAPADVASLIAIVERYGANAWALGARIAGAASRGLVDLFVYVAGVVFLLLDGERAWAWTLEHAPLSRRHLERFGAAFRETGSGLLLGVGLTTAAQAIAATVIYAALGVPRAWLFGPLTGVASVVPLVGSALVWAPLAVGFALAGAAPKAVALAALGVLVIGTIDNVLRPVFSKMGALDMHVYLLVIAIFGGLATMGAAGAAFGPLLVRMTIEALRLHREEQAQGG